jgi:hypothetical protein
MLARYLVQVRRLLILTLAAEVEEEVITAEALLILLQHLRPNLLLQIQ